MKGLFFFASLCLITLWLLQTSKTIEWVPYTEKVAGIVKVQKSRFEWHPERFVPFMKKLPGEIEDFLKKKAGRLRQRSSQIQASSLFTFYFVQF